MLQPGYGQHPQVVYVGITSHDNIPFDSACVLRPGDHPFIRHDSYVAYRHIRIDSEAHMIRMVNSGLWTVQAQCSNAVLASVIQGASASRLIPREFKKMFS